MYGGAVVPKNVRRRCWDKPQIQVRSQTIYCVWINNACYLVTDGGSSTLQVNWILVLPLRTADHTLGTGGCSRAATAPTRGAPRPWCGSQRPQVRGGGLRFRPTPDVVHRRLKAGEHNQRVDTALSTCLRSLPCRSTLPNRACSSDGLHHCTAEC